MIIHQYEGKATYNGERLYLEKSELIQAGFQPGVRFSTTINEDSLIELEVSESGANRVSQKMRKDKVIPIIDKTGFDIKEALVDCKHIVVTIHSGRVTIKGIKSTADQLKQSIGNQYNSFDQHKELTTISFCAGAGVSTSALVAAGFKEIAAVEYNPKEGRENKFSDIYMKNHKDAIMFNVPMQHLNADDLPSADVWTATLDCSDYSKASNGSKKSFSTMHLFMHLMRLYWEKDEKDRPIALLLENVAEFQKVSGTSLKLCLEEEGFYVQMAKVNSLDYGSRTKRERFFMVASIFKGFTFPLGEGKATSSIHDSGVLKVEDLTWVTAEEHGTLKYFLDRQVKGITHNHVMTVFDITKDSYLGTITRSHSKIQPENWIKHPQIPGLYSYLTGEQVKAIHGIEPNFYAGDSNKLIVESIGQSVCFNTFQSIALKLRTFLENQIKKCRDNVPSITSSFLVDKTGQLAMF